MQLKPLFKDIANAIRWKDGTTGPIAAENFPSRIRNIAGSGTGNNIFQALEILRPPIRTVYKVGQKLDMDGVKAKVYAYGGYVYDADVDSLSFTPANGAEITAALQSVKVTYSSLDGAYEISNYLPVSVDASPAACFGVMWNYGEESSELTRLTPESDPNGFVTACPDTEPVPYAGGTDRQPSSPFDNYFPWRKMQEYNIVGDTVTAKQGDAGFSRANFDTMVYIPEFYYNVVKDETEKTICYYHNGNSELVMGAALKKYPRGSFYLATKFPGYDLSNMPKVKEIFEKQLEKCQVEYFDFYLFHNVCEMNIDAYLGDEKYGIFSYLMEQKKAGRIKHLGFSIHGGYEVLDRFLAAYGEHMEFCQIQLNYLDWSFQDAKAKVERLHKEGIPVWVMEPLRGGRLAKLAPQEEEKLRAMRPDETVPAWAFRFLQSLPGVTVTLSGMSNFQQMQENIRTFEDEKPLTEKEMSGLLALADGMLSGKLPCTACRYCTSHCPQGLDIPALLGLYNEHSFTGGGFIAPMALSALPEEKRPSACIGCKSCEAVCPQQIKISEAMADFTAKLGS